MQNEKLPENIQDNENKKKEPNAFVRFLKNVVFQNLGLKITALMFSMILWGVVLTTEDLPRIKVIDDVPVHFQNEQALQDKGLVVNGKPLENLGIEFRVSTPITKYREMGSYYLSAEVNLGDVNTTGPHTLRIITNSSLNETDVKSTSPETVVVDIDYLEREKEIPLTVEYAGDLPEGYWHDTPVITRRGQSVSNVFISGPRQEVQKVVKAVCYISRYNVKETLSEAVKLVFLDAEGNEIDPSLFLDGEISVNVEMTVLSMKTVPVDAMGSLINVQDMNQNFEIVSANANPDHVSVVGEQSILDDVKGVLVEFIDVVDQRATIVERRKLLPPASGVRLFYGGEEIDEADVTVTISEKRVSRTFEAIPVEVVGINDRSMRATVLPETVDVTVYGRISLVNRLDRDDITAYVDLTGRALGSGILNNQELLVRFDDTEEVNDELLAGVMLSTNNVIITLEKR